MSQIGDQGLEWSNVKPEKALVRTLLDTDAHDGSTIALETVAPDAFDARATEAEKFAVKRRAKVSLLSFFAHFTSVCCFK